MQKNTSAYVCIAVLASIAALLNGCGGGGPKCVLNAKQRNILTGATENVTVTVSWGKGEDSSAVSPCCDGWKEVVGGGTPNQTYEQACGKYGSEVRSSFKGGSCDDSGSGCRYVGGESFFGLPDSCCGENYPPQCSYDGGYCFVNVHWWDEYCMANPCGNGIATKAKNVTALID